MCWAATRNSAATRWNAASRVCNACFGVTADFETLQS
jgi:hypothetical protein